MTTSRAGGGGEVRREGMEGEVREKRDNVEIKMRWKNREEKEDSGQKVAGKTK